MDINLCHPFRAQFGIIVFITYGVAIGLVYKVLAGLR
jgi:hypothetical protein